VIYEIVPPRKDTSRFSTELRGVDDVLHDSRIAAINIPELVNRRKDQGLAHYSPATIPPEEYAMMIKDYKESIVNIIAPRLTKDEFLNRARKILNNYKITNLVLVGKERREDILPGPDVVEALRLLRQERSEHVALGGICIFNRVSPPSAEYPSPGGGLNEPQRVLTKARAGCDFVTSQITFDAKPALDFLRGYHSLCKRSNASPLTVFISLATLPTPSILTLVERLDVPVPKRTKSRLLGNNNMGEESLKIATEVFQEILSGAESEGVDVPLGLQVEQIGVYNDELSLRLLDSLYPLL